MSPQTTTHKSNIILGLTMGEPGGIGGELVLKTWIERQQNNVHPFFIIDDIERLNSLADKLGWTINTQEIAAPSETPSVFNNALPVLPLGNIGDYVLGEANASTASHVCKSIEMAVDLANRKLIQGIITNPIQKNALYDAGFNYPGHTEFIAHLCNAPKPVMMLTSPELRVIPISIHESIAKAISSINTETIIQKTRIAVDSLRNDFGIKSPRIAMAGLNPHAGENGSMGDEELKIIIPAIETLRREGINVTDPVPPDALFMARLRPSYDVAMCHYHDQALIPIKALDVDRAVNVTLGLPIIRTSPDHGTALDIAGKGVAEPHSLIAAIQMAHDIARNRDTT